MGGWKSAWTGGQYSFVRALASLLLAVLLLDATLSAGAFWYFPASMVVASIALAVGFGGRALAAVFAILLPFSGTDFSDAWAISVASVWLFLHLGLPPAPYGSLHARGRTDPAGGWTMPGWYPFFCHALFVISRVAAALHAAGNGNTWLAAAFGVAAALALVPATAFPAWILSFTVGIYVAIGGDSSVAAVLLLHLLTFQPAWIPRPTPRQADAARPTVFYDGSCALCHTAVRFLLAEDVDPPSFRIAPLESATFVERVPERVRVMRPDSIVLARDDQTLVRGVAVVAILEALGGFWSMLAAVLALVPRGMLDAAYDAVASRRYRWFGRRSDVCPLMPATLASRIDR